MDNHNGMNGRKMSNWELQKELANFAVEYKRQNRKKELKENRKMLFWAYGPGVAMVLFIVIMILTLVWASNGNWMFYPMVILLMVSVIAVSAMMVIATILFMKYACDNLRLRVSQQIVWVVAFYFFNLFIFPLYFHEHILYKNLDDEKERFMRAWEETGEGIV